VTVDARSSSRPGRSSTGTAPSSGGAGPTRIAGPGVLLFLTRPSSSSFDWRERTRAGLSPDRRRTQEARRHPVEDERGRGAPPSRPSTRSST
jgi:hypothetical protein